MKVDRILKETILEKFHLGKAIVITGPRQTGKTTLINEVLKEFDTPLFINGDDFNNKQMLEQPNTQFLERLIGKNKIVFIDEAQKINNIGITAKIIIDKFKDVQLILSGSSTFDLNNQINEPLTGRKWEYHLFPISWKEFQDNVGFLDAKNKLEDRILYGMYPDVLNFVGEEVEVLNNLKNSYLYKDVLALSGIKKPDVLQKLTQALALQIGNEVSYNELAQLCGINKETVSNYIDLLEKAFVVFRLHPFSRNIRNEIKTNRKIYFYDTGIRNAVISNFNPLHLRNDKGALWENFLISERIKFLNYQKDYSKYYFWRTVQQQEIDWVEEKDGKINAYEFKWNDRKKARAPKKFIEAYKASFSVVNSSNFYDFVE